MKWRHDWAQEAWWRTLGNKRRQISRSDQGQGFCKFSSFRLGGQLDDDSGKWNEDSHLWVEIIIRLFASSQALVGWFWLRWQMKWRHWARSRSGFLQGGNTSGFGWLCLRHPLNPPQLWWEPSHLSSNSHTISTNKCKDFLGFYERGRGVGVLHWAM